MKRYLVKQDGTGLFWTQRKRRPFEFSQFGGREWKTEDGATKAAQRLIDHARSTGACSIPNVSVVEHTFQLRNERRLS